MKQRWRIINTHYSSYILPYTLRKKERNYAVWNKVCLNRFIKFEVLVLINFIPDGSKTS